MLTGCANALDRVEAGDALIKSLTDENGALKEDIRQKLSIIGKQSETIEAQKQEKLALQVVIEANTLALQKSSSLIEVQSKRIAEQDATIKKLQEKARRRGKFALGTSAGMLLLIAVLLL